MASLHPRFGELRPDEFYYDFCYKRNLSSTQSVAHSIVFGEARATHDVVVPSESDKYLEITPRLPTFLGKETLKQWVTLTDDKSFVFISMCWSGADERAWLVFSSKPRLDPTTENLIIEHAVSQGFKRENAVFIRYDGCTNIR